MGRVANALRTSLRRVHMFLGLLMYPWVVFFGISGALFNHPNLWEDVTVKPLPPPRFAELTGMGALRAQEMATRLVAQVDGYELDPDVVPHYEGAAILQADAAGKRLMLFVDLENGRGAMVERRALPREPNPFEGVRVMVPELTLLEIEKRAANVASVLGASDAPVRGRPAILPELRFRVRDRSGAPYNVTYDVATGRLDGRPVSRFPALGFKDWMSRLHRTHHYGSGWGKGFFWPLLQDLAGITLVVWALTGLVMVWQMPRWRLPGIVAASVALLSAGLVFWDVMHDAAFGNVHRAEGPGED